MEEHDPRDHEVDGNTVDGNAEDRAAGGADGTATGSAVGAGPTRRRDVPRIAAWSLAAVAAVVGLAGVIHEPAPDIEVVFGNASFLMQVGLLDEARAELEAVLEREPDHKGARLYLATIQQASGDEDAAALANFLAGEDVLVQHGDPKLLEDFHASTAVLRLRLGDRDGALEDARWLADHARPAAGFLIQALTSVANMDDTGFRQNLARAYAADPLDPLFRLDRGLLAEAMPWATAPISTDRTGLFPLR